MASSFKVKSNALFNEKGQVRPLEETMKIPGSAEEEAYNRQAQS